LSGQLKLKGNDRTEVFQIFRHSKSQTLSSPSILTLRPRALWIGAVCERMLS
jgi:hypothetical protein